MNSASLTLIKQPSRLRTASATSANPYDEARGVRPRTRAEFERWLQAFTGLRLASNPVCEGHTPPLEIAWRLFSNPPGLGLIHGPRGGGKSLISGIVTHTDSRWMPGLGTRILGGSKAQSQQIYDALRLITRGGAGPLGSDEDTLAHLHKTECLYKNGSEVAILACSETSVRGPHVARLRLDEVDEIPDDLRETAFGMAMQLKGSPSSTIMTSTWHRVAGPMAGLTDRARAGEFPLWSFCVFDVLETCPDERSGRNLEKCPECPLMRWCHEDRQRHPQGLPKAKRSNGHYAIDDLISKIAGVSERVLEADYLSRQPRAAGVWFSTFDSLSNVSDKAEFDPRRPVHLAIDTGVHTGAVWFQVLDQGGNLAVNVFADYLTEGLPAEANAREILETSRQRCRGIVHIASTDPAGSSRTAVGPTVIGEYERVGFRELRHWPQSRVSDGLQLLESFVRSADGEVNLLIHPRCVSLITALQNYRRAKRGGQFQDYPEDPQHPHEDLIDPLRGGLMLAFPEGRRPARAPFRTVRPSQLF